MNKGDFEDAVAEGLAAAVPFWYLIAAGFMVGVVLAVVWVMHGNG